MSRTPWRVACETTVTTGHVQNYGGDQHQLLSDIPKIARNVIREIGYDRAKYGFEPIPAAGDLYRRTVRRYRHGRHQALETKTGSSADSDDLIGAGDQA
jgi:S-adenosylmethionine synthetase